MLHASERALGLATLHERQGMLLGQEVRRLLAQRSVGFLRGEADNEAEAGGQYL